MSILGAILYKELKARIGPNCKLVCLSQIPKNIQLVYHNIL